MEEINTSKILQETIDLSLKVYNEIIDIFNLYQVNIVESFNILQEIADQLFITKTGVAINSYTPPSLNQTNKKIYFEILTVLENNNLTLDFGYGVIQCLADTVYYQFTKEKNPLGFNML